MDGVRTRGHPAALAAVLAMVRGRAPHAVLLVGPAGVGKTTLAADLAAGLLCAAPDRDARPCGACRGCRLVASGGHPDVHRLSPDGPGRQVVIGGPGSKVRGIRDLVSALALMPVEGGARVAIIESAQRMNEDAQAALLKTLEEPPAGVTLILCADAEEPLLPTIRSRCARLRLGPVGPREIEAILAEHGIADPALAARLARIADGRPGHALAWAADPDALRQRDQLTRVLLDLTAARPSERLTAIRAATNAAGAFAKIGDGSAAGAGAERADRPVAPAKMGRRGTGGSTTTPEPGDGDAAISAEPGTDGDAAPVPADADVEVAIATKTPAAERRRAAEAVISIWTDVARDLVLSRHGLSGSLRDPRLLEETATIAADLDEPGLGAFMERLGRAGVLLAGNVGPELILDDLALAWPQRGDATA